MPDCLAAGAWEWAPQLAWLVAGGFAVYLVGVVVAGIRPRHLRMT